MNLYSSPYGVYTDQGIRHEEEQYYTMKCCAFEVLDEETMNDLIALHYVFNVEKL